MPGIPIIAQRFELKYIIPQGLALQVREFIQPYVTLDTHAAGRADLSYPVHSLYLDSPALTLYQSTINGDRNRFKMRVRYYDESPDSPAYFETKRRQDNVISKERCALRRAAAAAIIAGRLPGHDDLCRPSTAEEQALLRFHARLQRLHARPVAHVCYRREAWFGIVGNRVRLTMDRQVRSCRQHELAFSTELRDPVMVFGDRVVLELKFTDRFPGWMRDLVQAVGLRPCSAAKYVDGIVRMEEHGLAAGLFPSCNHGDRVERRLLRQKERSHAPFSAP
jgi:hypothetical protein